jgi:Uma2 family endonuclease
MNSIDDLDFSKTYTYADYLLWKFEERVELIKGKIFKMSPAPSVNHQKITVNVLRPIANFLFDKKCEIFVAPFDVRLVGEDKIDKKVKTVVQPDLCVVCDPSKIADNRSCLGAPDLVVEILSPGNNTKELKIKYDLYEEFGVREYWIIYPDERSVLKYELSSQGKFVQQMRAFTLGDKITTSILPGFELALDDVFRNLL